MIVVELPQRTLEAEIELLEEMLEGKESTEVGSFLMGALASLRWVSLGEKRPSIAAMFEFDD